MAPQLQELQQADSHGDVIHWPLKALCDYLEATNDLAFLDRTRAERIDAAGAQIKSLEEGIKRLQGGALDKAPAGDRVKSFRGRGNRRYISSLQMKGKRILVLLDISASMMDEDVAKVIKLRNQPEPMRRAAQKWRRSLDMVEWITAQLPDNSQFQVYGFNTKAKPLFAKSGTEWLSANDPRAINDVITAARGVTPAEGTSLVNAFLAIRTLTPQPDQIILITDGQPTAHCEGDRLYLQYPPSQRTIAATPSAIADSTANAIVAVSRLRRESRISSSS